MWFFCCCKRLLLFEMGLVTVDGRGTRYRSLAYKQGKLKSLLPVAVYMYLFATCLHINKCTHTVTWTLFFGKAHQMVFLFNIHGILWSHLVLLAIYSTNSVLRCYMWLLTAGTSSHYWLRQHSWVALCSVILHALYSVIWETPSSLLRTSFHFCCWFFLHLRTSLGLEIHV